MGIRDGAIAAGTVEGPYLELAYSYDGSLEGLFSAVFAAYERREHPGEVLRTDAVQMRLGQEVVPIETDVVRAERVARRLFERFGEGYGRVVCQSALSDSPEAATAIYRLIRYSMDEFAPRKSGGATPLDSLSHPVVRPVLSLHRAVVNEAERMRQFIRFEHKEGDVWFARCNPNASVVPLVMGYFSARLNTQAFIIYDETHHLAGVHGRSGRMGKGSWYLAKVEDPAVILPAPEEREMQEAWRAFYRAVSLPDRYHPELRRSFMPMRLWRNITELQPSRSDTQESSGALPCPILSARREKTPR